MHQSEAKIIMTLLLSKGVDESYIYNLDKRKVLHINSRLYKEKTIENKGVYFDIPVSKIVSTHRTLISHQSWWENIFGPHRNVNLNKWNPIKNQLEGEKCIQDFRDYFYNTIPPINNVVYYPELDLYEVKEGHHRTIWAILTGMKKIKASAKTVAILNRNELEDRRTFLKDVSKTRKEINYFQSLLNELMDNMHLSCDEELINYKGTTICYYRPYKASKPLFDTEFYDLDNYKYHLESLNFAHGKIIEIASLHQKYRYLPMPIKIKLFSLYSLFSQDKPYNILKELYEQNWIPSIK